MTNEQLEQLIDESFKQAVKDGTVIYDKLLYDCIVSSNRQHTYTDGVCRMCGMAEVE